MYRAFFGLGEAPFRITPDPRFLYLDPMVEAALAAITGGISERAGLLLLVGEVGTGKTTLVRRLLDTLPPEVRTVLVLHPTVGFEEILDHVLLELGLPVSGGAPEALLERLAEFLREHARDGGTVAVFFDEAQALRDSTLAALPRLLDLVTDDGRPGIQLVLVGQPELDGRLAAPGLEEVRARIRRSARLVPLSPDGVAAYVRARLTHAGATDVELFTADAIERLAARSRGVPRAINVLCESALVAAFAEGQRRITGHLVEAAWADYAPLHEPGGAPMPTAPPGHPDTEPAETPRTSHRRRLLVAAIAVGVLALIPLLATRPWRSAPAHPPTTVESSLPATPPATTPAPPEETPTTAPAPVDERPAPRAAPPSAVDAIALVDRFWQAYGARDDESLRALFAPEAAPTGPVLDVDPTGGGALVTPAEAIEAKPIGDRVTVRVPFVLSTRDQRGRPVRRQGVASLQVAMRDGTPCIVALSAESGPVPR
jgi:general secretion pathway protein A